MSDRVGTLNSDGTVATWPKKDVRGDDYTRPCPTQKISGTQFVVLPHGLAPEACRPLVDEVKAELERQKTAEPKAESKKKAEPDEN